MLTGATRWPPADARRYRAAGYWSGETLADIARTPVPGQDNGRPALVTADARIGYLELDRRCARVAGGLAALGVRSGDRWVVQLPNSVELVVTCLALFRLGAIPVLALAAHRTAEIGYLCTHTDAVGLVVPDVNGGHDYRELARAVRSAAPRLRHVVVAGDAEEFTPLVEIAAADGIAPPPPDPDEVALCLLSGGTTGRPKLIPRTHNDYAFQLRETARAMHLDRSGAYLAALPIAHNAALGCPGVLGALRCGATAVLADNPAPDHVFPLIGREGVTLTTLMPAFLPLWASMVDLFDVDLSRLVIEVGGARLDPAVARSAEAVLGCTVTRWFGMGEGLLCFTRPEDPPELRLSTEGRPLCADDELIVVDSDDRPVPVGEIGELLTRGPYTLRGYYRADEYNRRVFTDDGFLRTGDLVRLTEAGALVVEGRTRDIVNRGGEKVPTGEVEDHLRAHPLVRDAALVAVPDRALGEKSTAFVIPDGGAPTLAALREFLLDRGLAAYKSPDHLELVERFPHTALGKVDKAALRDSVTRSRVG